MFVFVNRVPSLLKVIGCSFYVVLQQVIYVGVVGLCLRQSLANSKATIDALNISYIFEKTMKY
jgi:hypothetical protein